MISYEFGKQSDLLTIVSGNDYVSELAITFSGETPYVLQGAKFAIFAIDDCSSEPIEVYVTDAVGFIAASNGETQELKFELTRSDSSIIAAGVRHYRYEVSAELVGGAVTRVTTGFCTVLDSVL